MVDKVSIDAARALWAEYEKQLYPMVISDSTGYQQALLAVRALADEMRNVASIEELVSMWPRAGEMLKSVVSTRGLSAWSLPQDGVAGAAFALREREIREHDQHQELQRRIGAACKSGDTWVVLDENGKIDSGLSDPYRCTEMHVASGLAVMSLVQPDPSLGTAIFVVTVIKLDPLTGELLDADPGIEDWVEHAHQEDFVAHREAVRDRISSGAIKDTQ
jgi:hypothetical protein